MVFNRMAVTIIPIKWHIVIKLLHHGFYTLLLYARDGTDDRLELDAGQSDGALPAVLWCELPTNNKAVPLPLPRLFGLLLHLE